MSSINKSSEENLVFVIYIPWWNFLTNWNWVKKSLKDLLNSCKLQIVFKSQRKLSNVLPFKDRLPFDLMSGVVYEYTFGSCNSTYYGETDRYYKLGLENVLGYHLWHLGKLNHQRRAQFTTIFWIAKHPVFWGVDHFDKRE